MSKGGLQRFDDSGVLYRFFDRRRFLDLSDTFRLRGKCLWSGDRSCFCRLGVADDSFARGWGTTQNLVDLGRKLGGPIRFMPDVALSQHLRLGRLSQNLGQARGRRQSARVKRLHVGQDCRQPPASVVPIAGQQRHPD